MSERRTYDILILGGGMVGLSLAHQIKKKDKNLSIKIIDKEEKLGLHNSGRNSGVLHAGIYYEPGSLKAKVCVEGAQRLKQWCLDENLDVLKCGKVIVTQKKTQNNELDKLFKRAKKNGAKVEFIDKKELKKHSSLIYNATEKALWSPNTCVVDPKSVLKKLGEKLFDLGIVIEFNLNNFKINVEQNYIEIQKKGTVEKLFYGHIFNCCGVHADEIARKFNICEDFKILPFKGLYWKLRSNNHYDFKTNIYPVPDLNVPFLGVHITPNTKGEIFLGPTAIPAFGKENYSGLKGFEPLLTVTFLKDLGKQWILNKNGFRRYAREQALQGIKPIFLKSAQSLIPSLKNEDLIKSSKVGIRAQLFDKKEGNLIQDFKLVNYKNSTHVLNAISPAFTASFALADLIIEKSPLNI
tara:strand:+ start:15358 stop:16587 length:1230 start_codon:yes stop_codon:yes gene_type:complete